MQIRLQVIIRGQRQEKGKTWTAVGRRSAQKGPKSPRLQLQLRVEWKVQFLWFIAIIIMKAAGAGNETTAGETKAKPQRWRQKGKPEEILRLKLFKIQREKKKRRNRNLCEVSTVIF